MWDCCHFIHCLPWCLDTNISVAKYTVESICRYNGYKNKHCQKYTMSFSCHPCPDDTLHYQAREDHTSHKCLYTVHVCQPQTSVIQIKRTKISITEGRRTRTELKEYWAICKMKSHLRLNFQKYCHFLQVHSLLGVPHRITWLSVSMAIVLHDHNLITVVNILKLLTYHTALYIVREENLQFECFLLTLNYEGCKIWRTFWI